MQLYKNYVSYNFQLICIRSRKNNEKKEIGFLCYNWSNWSKSIKTKIIKTKIISRGWFSRTAEHPRERKIDVRAKRFFGSGENLSRGFSLARAPNKAMNSGWMTSTPSSLLLSSKNWPIMYIEKRESERSARVEVNGWQINEATLVCAGT